MAKKNTIPAYTSFTSVAQIPPESSTFKIGTWFIDKILPSLFVMAVGAGMGLIVFYFALQSTATVVRAIPDTYVRKDVLEPQLVEMNRKLDKIDGRLDQLTSQKSQQSNAVLRSAPSPFITIVPAQPGQSVTYVGSEPQQGSPTPSPTPLPSYIPTPSLFIPIIPSIKELL